MEIAEEAGCATLEMEAMPPASWMLEMAVAIRTPVKADGAHDILDEAPRSDIS